MPQDDDGGGGGPSQAAIERAARAAWRDGSTQVRIDGERPALLATIAALARQDVDVIIRVDGLSPDTIADSAKALCDFAIDSGVPLQFEHRGRLLQLAVR